MKKIIKTLLVVMVLAVVLTAFTGCDAVETLKDIIPPTIADLIPPQLTCAVLGHKGGEANCLQLAECERCGVEYGELGEHEEAYKGAVNPTCEESGLTVGMFCPLCGETFHEQVVVPAKGHTPVDVEAVDPTCSTDGRTAGTACDVCDKVLSGCEVIPADPTAHGEAVEIEALDPTCSTSGHTAGTGCEYCGTPYTGCEEIAIDPDAHYFVSVAWGDYSVYGYCALCEGFEYGIGSFTRNVTADYGVDDLGGFYEFVFIYVAEAGHYVVNGGETVVASLWSYSAGTQIGTWGNAWLEEGFYVLGLNYYGGVGEYTVTVAIAHDYKDGYCACGAVDPDYYFTVTIPEALEKADGSKVIVSGTVVGIYEPYNPTFNNTAVYVADAEGNKILLYRLPGNWSLGDKLTVKGTISIYKGTAQVAAGAEVVEYTDVTRVYLNDVKGWTQPYFYTWEPEVAAWPGKAMTYDSELGLWYYDVPAGNVWVIFNDGNGAQTGDLTISEGSDLVFDNADVYTVAGSSGLCGSEWSTTDTANDMTYDAETDTYTKVYTNVKAGTYEFKCVKDHAWTTAYPDSNKSVTVATDGSTVVITLKGTTVSVEVIAPATESTTVTVSIADYADANSWSNSVQYSSITMDENITVTATGVSNTGKYYTSGENWRIYQSESPSVTVEAAVGKTIVSVKITYTSQNTGALTLDGSVVASDAVITVNGTSVTFGVGNTETATNGQARITAIEVIYK